MKQVCELTKETTLKACEDQPMRRRWLVAGCLVVATFAACGGGDGGDEEPADQKATAEAPSQAQLDSLETVLKNAATAEEAYAVENFTYTASVTELEATGLNVPPDITVEVVAATDSSYCLEASLDGTVMYLDSATNDAQEGNC